MEEWEVHFVQAMEGHPVDVEGGHADEEELDRRNLKMKYFCHLRYERGLEEAVLYQNEMTEVVVVVDALHDHHERPQPEQAEVAVSQVLMGLKVLLVKMELQTWAEEVEPVEPLTTFQK